MATEFEKLRDDLPTLPVESRASLAQSLIERLDDAVDQNAEMLWLKEIGRRDSEIRAGTANLKPVDQVLREARELLRCLKIALHEGVDREFKSAITFMSRANAASEKRSSNGWPSPLI